MIVNYHATNAALKLLLSIHTVAGCFFYEPGKC